MMKVIIIRTAGTNCDADMKLSTFSFTRKNSFPHLEGAYV